MAKDYLFTNGAIAVKEKALLGDRLVRMCETDAEECIRLLTECGFGGGAEVSSAHDFEILIAGEERATDEFIREYAPSEAEKAYLLLPRDFHNAKALVKAEQFSIDAAPMLAPQGLIPIERLARAAQGGDVDGLGLLGGAIREASALFSERETQPSGAEVGALFERALFCALKKACAGNRTLKRLFAAKADMTNLLTAFRSPDGAIAERFYVTGGTLAPKRLSLIFGDAERAEREFAATPYRAFVEECFAAKRANKPYTQPERMLQSYELNAFAARRYALEGNEPFLYYVLRRRAECEDVRILFVCLFAGMAEAEIKARLRSRREGI